MAELARGAARDRRGEARGQFEVFCTYFERSEGLTESSSCGEVRKAQPGVGEAVLAGARPLQAQERRSGCEFFLQQLIES